MVGAYHTYQGHPICAQITDYRFLQYYDKRSSVAVVVVVVVTEDQLASWFAIALQRYRIHFS